MWNGTSFIRSYNNCSNSRNDENFDISKLGPKNPETWRIIGDASRLAFADRSIYIADSDFIMSQLKS